jgi:ribonucleoside-diphosphate reductase alpha chain
MLVHLGIPYDSDSARDLCRDIVSFINYQTKVASHNLAKTRGSFGAMNSVLKSRYSENPGFIEQKYGTLKTNTVTTSEWAQLGSEIRETRMLRNSSTISLPPTGRSGLVVSASTGVEPLFTLISDGEIHPALLEQLQIHGVADQSTIAKIYETGSCQDSALPDEIIKIFKTATEINPSGHLKMVSAILPCVDESISKTINLPNEATVEEVKSIYMEAQRSGLKGVTIYRNGSVKNQPRKLAR